MNGRVLLWGWGFLALGTLVASGWIGSSFSTGPRAGAASLLLVIGLVLIVSAFAARIQSRTERLDSKGGCPVGATCPCGHFNFKPAKTCKQCGLRTAYAIAKA